MVKVIHINEVLKEIGQRFGHFHDDYLEMAGQLFLNEARRQITEYAPLQHVRPEDWCVALQTDYPDLFRQ